MMSRIDKEGFPSNYFLAKELLKQLYLRAKPVTPRELYQPLADALKVTGYQLTIKRATTDGNKWENRVQAARNHLVKKGFVKNGLRGYWSLTQEGILEAIKQEKLAAEFEELDKKTGLGGS